MIKRVVLDIPCIIELTCGACELVASFPLEFLDSFCRAKHGINNRHLRGNE